MTAYDGQSITYDAAGYPSSYLGLNLTWTGGRLTTVTEGTYVRSYTYGSDGLRIRREVGGSTYRYLYDGGTLVRIEREMQDSFDYLDFLFDGQRPVGFRYCNPALGYDAIFYYLFGQGNNVEAIVDAYGNVLVSYVYDAWGNFTETYVGIDPDDLDDPAVYSALTLSPLRYRSYVYDYETGFYYLQSRYYDPEVGRFISPDEVDYLDPNSFQGLNLYAYCGNDPINRFDPTGHFWDTFFDVISLIYDIYCLVTNDGHKDWKNWAALKKGRYYYLDLPEVIICSGFSSMHRILYSAYNFSVKAVNSEEERKPNNMFDGYDSMEIQMYFDKKAAGYRKKEIRYDVWEAEQYAIALDKLLHEYFDPYKKDALGHIRRCYQIIGFVHEGEIIMVQTKTRAYLGLN